MITTQQQREEAAAARRESERAPILARRADAQRRRVEWQRKAADLEPAVAAARADRDAAELKLRRQVWAQGGASYEANVALQDVLECDRKLRASADPVLTAAREAVHRLDCGINLPTAARRGALREALEELDGLRLVATPPHLWQRLERTRERLAAAGVLPADWPA